MASDIFEKNITKKYPKQQILNILWQTLRPKLAILPNFWDHILIVFNILFLFGPQDRQQSVSTWKFSLKISNVFYVQKRGRENCENIVLVIYYNFF